MPPRRARSRAAPVRMLPYFTQRGMTAGAVSSESSSSRGMSCSMRCNLRFWCFSNRTAVAGEYFRVLACALLLDARALLLCELALAIGAAQLPLRVAQVAMVAVEAVLAERAGHPEDTRHRLNLADASQLLGRDELLQDSALQDVARNVEPRLEGAADRLGGVDDHLAGHDVVHLGGIEGVAFDVLDHVHVFGRLDAGGHGPQHLLFAENVDVGIDHDHVLHEIDRAQGDQRRLFRLAVNLLVDADVAVEAAHAAGRQVDGSDRGHDAFDAVVDGALLGEGAHRPYIAVAGEDVLVNRLAAAGDGLDLDHPAHPLRPVRTGKLAERAFDLARAGQDLALDEDVGVGRDQDVGAPYLARGEAQRTVHNRADDLIVVLAERGDVQGADEIGRMVADHDDDGRRLAALLVLADDLPIVAGGHVQAELARALVLHAQEGGIVGAAVGIAHEGRHVDVGPAVHAVVADDGELAEISALAHLDNLFHRRGGFGNDLRFEATLLAAGVFQREGQAEVLGRQAHGDSAALTAGVDIGGDRELRDSAEEVERTVEDH